jgi:hypothetical protein
MQANFWEVNITDCIVAFATVATACIYFIQAHIMGKQAGTMEEQSAIQQKQTEIMEKQMVISDKQANIVDKQLLAERTAIEVLQPSCSPNGDQISTVDVNLNIINNSLFLKRVASIKPLSPIDGYVIKNANLSENVFYFGNHTYTIIRPKSQDKSEQNIKFEVRRTGEKPLNEISFLLTIEDLCRSEVTEIFKICILHSRESKFNFKIMPVELVSP